MRQQLLETQRNLIESQLANCSDSGAQASSSTAPVQPISKPMNIQALLAHGAGKGTPQQALAQAMAAVHQQTVTTLLANEQCLPASKRPILALLPSHVFYSLYI